MKLRTFAIGVLCAIFGILPKISFGVLTQPSPQAVPFSQDFTSFLSSSTIYPSGWQGWQIASAPSASFRTVAPLSDVTLTAPGTAASTTGGMYNYNGKIGLLQSSAADLSLCFVINTTGLTGNTVTYDVMTIRNPYNGTTNKRIIEVTLQYRTDTTSSFISLTGIEYQNNTTTQTTAVTTPQNLQNKTIMLPASCDNQPIVQLRWVTRNISGAGSYPSVAFDNILVNACSTNTSTYYYRSFTSGNWNTGSTWEASPTGLPPWITACTPPTNAAAGITIQTGHTVTIDVIATAPDLTINTGGVLTANSTSFVSLTISGNLINDGTFQMVNGLFGVDAVFNKNGNQSITGTGSTTNFYSIGLNMGSSINNILDISPTNFSCSLSRPLLFNSSNINVLSNGTIKFSGSFVFTGKLFKTGTSYSIVATAGVWLNNSNVTIPGSNDSYDVSGLLRITNGTLNAGTLAANAIRLLNGSSMIVEGGSVNVSGRIQGYNVAGTIAQITSYSQSGGTVTLSAAGQNTSSLMPEFAFDTIASFTMSGGTIIFRNQAATTDDLYIYCASSSVTGGTIQIADASTTVANSAGFLIESQSALPSLVIYKPAGFNPKVKLGNDLKIIGGITINNGTTLDNRYSSLLQYDISLTGNWLNDGTFVNNGVKKVTFNGSAAQQLSGTTSTSFNNLTINNSSGGVTLLSPASVNATLTLTNGYLYSSTLNLLSLNSASSATGASNSSFVYGPMSKTGSSDFIFPVGKDLKYRPIAATALSGSETFTAEYFHADPDPTYSRYSKDIALDHLDGCEYWILNRAGSVNANVTLSWDTYSCGVTSLPDLTIARWDAGLGMWKDQGNGGTTGTITAGTIISNSLVTSFSPFTLASTLGGQNPLPIELLSFEAIYNGKDAVNLKWATASENNNDYFTIERSADTENFTEIKKVDGNNTRDIHNYTMTDNSPLKGISYYRLKQTDFNGAYTYSNIVAVNIVKTDFDILNVFNDENENLLKIELHSNQNNMLQIQLMDMNGKIIYNSSQLISSNNSDILISTSEISRGIYLLRVFNSTGYLLNKIKI